MNTKKILCAITCLLLIGTAATAVFAEDAAVIPAETVRLSVNVIPNYVMHFQEWEGSPSEPAMFFNSGLGIEYGVCDWLNVQAIWLPGVNFGHSDKYGNMHDIFAGTKAAILGQDALFGKSLNMLLSAALGINIPLTSIFEPKGTNVNETDTLLWGTVLRVYYDVFFTSWFTLNAFAEAVYYPNQISADTAYGKGMIEHPFDFSIEAEPRFEYAKKNGDIFRVGIPMRFFYSPSLNMANNATDVLQYCLTVSAYFGLVFTRPFGPPFKETEVYLRYDAAIVGQNVIPLHRVGIMVKFLFGKDKKAEETEELR
jgi:hypothetical protein